MLDLLQKAAKLGMDVPACLAPGCYKGKLPDCTTCLSCRGTGLDEDPARVLMAVVMWQFSRGEGFEGIWPSDVSVYGARSWAHNGTPDQLAKAALRAAIAQAEDAVSLRKLVGP